MKNFLKEIFNDLVLSLVTKKYGNQLNDDQREEKADEIIRILHDTNSYTVEMAQALIDKKGFNSFYNTQINGQPVIGLVKEGMFHKPKTCYFITRNKEKLDTAYLDQIYDELRRQAQGDNVFNSPDFKP
ncbi:hypothetical protein [Ruminococcus sp. FC2018]|uniref:hypothetical protein n=1 Tax=Ruminococcus sp. FC2018 TaxID=1410617 RepID=UPI00048BD4F9|nr:hypothetical protein [Ruminococcus sp. FC2018]